MLYPIQTLWGSKRFDSGISISFKRKCNIIMQIQYTKKITDPGRFELEVTLSKPTRSVMLEWNWYQRFMNITRKSHQNVVKSRFPGNFKTGHFKSLIGEKGAAKWTQLKKCTWKACKIAPYHENSIRSTIYVLESLETRELVADLDITPPFNSLNSHTIT